MGRRSIRAGARLVDARAAACATLRDGGCITIPQEAVYGLHLKRVIESRGVAPGIEAHISSGELLARHDAPLEAAVNHLPGRLKEHPAGLPPPELPGRPPGLAR